MTRTRIIGIVALAALLIAGLATRGFGLFGAHQPMELALSGNVDIRQVDLGFRVAGRIAAIPFDEGALVSAGAVLARLDAAPLKQAPKQLRAQVGVNAAELAKQRNGNRPQDIAQAAAVLDQAQATLSRTKADFERYAILVKTDAVSQSSYESNREAYQTAQGKVAAATRRSRCNGRARGRRILTPPPPSSASQRHKATRRIPISPTRCFVRLTMA